MIIRICVLPIPYQVPANFVQKYKKVQKYANKTDKFCQSVLILYLCTAFGHIQRTIIMAKIFKTIAPVDSMSGMIGSREANLSGKAVIANVRKKGGNWNGGNPYQYFSVLTRTTATANPTQSVLDNRVKFAAVAAATRERLGDPTQKVQDQAAFREQTKYKTMYSYVWNLEWDSYTPA